MAMANDPDPHSHSDTCMFFLRTYSYYLLLYVSLSRFPFVSFIAHIVDPLLVDFRLDPQIFHLLSLDFYLLSFASRSCIKARRDSLMFPRRSTPVSALVS